MDKKTILITLVALAALLFFGCTQQGIQNNLPDTNATELTNSTGDEWINNTETTDSIIASDIDTINSESNVSWTDETQNVSIGEVM